MLSQGATLVPTPPATKQCYMCHPTVVCGGYLKSLPKCLMRVHGSLFSSCTHGSSFSLPPFSLHLPTSLVPTFPACSLIQNSSPAFRSRLHECRLNITFDPESIQDGWAALLEACREGSGWRWIQGVKHVRALSLC